jgi:hypothetical protein
MVNDGRQRLAQSDARHKWSSEAGTARRRAFAQPTFVIPVDRNPL